LLGPFGWLLVWVRWNPRASASRVRRPAVGEPSSEDWSEV